MTRGQPKTPVVGYGPVADLVRKLRAERDQAGRPVGRRMAEVAKFSRSTLSECDRGLKLPTWEATAGYLRACGLPPSDIEGRWRSLHDDVAKQDREFVPDLAVITTHRALFDRAVELMRSRGVAVHTVVENLRAFAAGPVSIKELPATRAVVEQLAAAVHDVSVVPSSDMVTCLLFGSGATPENLKHWQKRWNQITTAGAADPTPSFDPDPAGAASPVAPPTSPAALTAWLAHRRRWLSVACAGLVLVTVVAVAASVVRRVNRPYPPVAPPAGPQTLTDPWAARDDVVSVLTELATRASVAADLASAGECSFVHFRTWSTGRPKDQEVRLWWAADLSGRRETVGPTAGRPIIETFGRGQFRVVIEQPAVDPLALRAQIAEEQPPQLGASGVLRAVADLNTYHAFDAAHHAAILQVLAATPGVTYQGLHIDRAGRTGIAVAAVTDASGVPTRDVLIFDADSGVLLAHEQATLTPPAMDSYDLYVARGRRECPYRTPR